MSINREDRAGKLDQRIIIEEPFLSTDSYGQAQYGPQAGQGNWSQVTECWAHIEDEYGLEQKQAAHEVNENWAVIQVRYLAGKDIKTNMRARHKVYGTIYDIRSVLVHVEKGRQIVEMNCVVVQ